MENKIFIATKQDLEQLIEESVDKAFAKNSNSFGKKALDMMNVEQASDFLNLAMATIYDKTSKNMIPHKKKGNKLYFIRAELEKWILEGDVKTDSQLEEMALDYVMRKPFGKVR